MERLEIGEDFKDIASELSLDSNPTKVASGIWVNTRQGFFL
jgi:hypothetical protein